jgi:hypothetical protein
LASQNAHTENVSFSPEVETFTPQFRFSELLPPDTYQSYHKAQQFYVGLSRTIKIWFGHPLVTASATLVWRAVDTQLASYENGGLTILMTALKLTLPHLSSVNVDC